MGTRTLLKEMTIPSNREYKGKGIKGRNYDEFSGFGTGSAGKTGTIDKLNDGGVGSPKLADSGNLQRAGGQPGETPAQGDSTRGPGRQQDGGSAANNQRGDRQR